MMSRIYLRAVAEMLIENDDKSPGFWADLVAEVARLQADQRSPEEPSHENPRVAATEGTEAALEVPCDAEEKAPTDPPQTAEEKTLDEAQKRQVNEALEHPFRASIRRVELERRLSRLFPGEIMGNISQGCWRCSGPDHFRRECPRRGETCAVQLLQLLLRTTKHHSAPQLSGGVAHAGPLCAKTTRETRSASMNETTTTHASATERLRTNKDCYRFFFFFSFLFVPILTFFYICFSIYYSH